MDIFEETVKAGAVPTCCYLLHNLLWLKSCRRLWAERVVLYDHDVHAVNVIVFESKLENRV